MLLNVTVVGDRELVARLDAMPGAVQKALALKIKQLALKMEAKVKTEKLNGQVLNRITGRLARSISNGVDSTVDHVIGRVYSSGDVKYARPHEFGFQGEVEVPEHERHVVFGREVNPFTVGPYTMRMNLPERSFLRSSLKDMTPEISKGMKDAVIGAIRKQVSG